MVSWSLCCTFGSVFDAQPFWKTLQQQQVPGTAQSENAEEVLGSKVIQQRHVKGNSCVHVWRLRVKKTRWQREKYLPGKGGEKRTFPMVVYYRRNREKYKETEEESCPAFSFLVIHQVKQWSISFCLMYWSEKGKKKKKKGCWIQMDPTVKQFTSWLICVSTPNTESLWKLPTVGPQLRNTTT